MDNVTVDTDCIDQQKFLDLLDSSNFVQKCKQTHPFAWSYTGLDTQPK